MNKLLKKIPFYNQRWFSFTRFLMRHFFEDDCQQKAASLTYTTMLSIVPIFTVLLMILSSVPALALVRAQIYELIYSNLLPQSSVQVSKYISEFAEKSTNLTAIGIIVLFITTIMTLTTIEKAFNQIWRVDDRSGGIKSILRYWTIVTLGPLVLGSAFIFSSAVQSLSFLNRQYAGYGIDWSFWIQAVSIGITMTGFIGMYWFIPKARVPLKNAVIAGMVVAITFELLKRIFGIVMTNFTSYEAIYGAFAALPIFLLWIYLSWNLILLGVEISYTLTIFETKEVYPRHPLLSLLDMLNLIYDHHQVGDAVSEQELRDVLGRKELPKWYTYINYLKDSDLITVTDDNEYVLKKDLNQMSLWDFYRTLPYPLPIKDELDEMDQSNIQPWLTLLINRFIATEHYAQRELDLPLAAIFANSSPRKKTEHQHHKQLAQTQAGKQMPPTDNHIDGKRQEGFRPHQSKEKDNANRQAIIPRSNRRSSDQHSNQYNGQHNDHYNDSRHSGSQFKQTSSNRSRQYLNFAKDDIITEADNPDLK